MAELQAPAIMPLALRSIYLRESSTRFRDNFDPLKPGQPLLMQAKFAPISYFENVDIPVDDNGIVTRSYTFITGFEFSYLAGPVDVSTASENVDDTDPVAKITAHIAVDYILTRGESLPTADRLQQWAGSAALLHAWPYWREFAHNTMLRMNLPVMMIPLLVSGPAALQSPADENQNQDEKVPPTAKRAKAKRSAKPSKE